MTNFRLALLHWAIAASIAFWAWGCSTEPDPAFVRTKLGIMVVNSELLAPGWEDTIDTAWVDAQICYDVVLDGSLVTVEIVTPFPCKYNPERQCVDEGGKIAGWAFRSGQKVTLPPDLEALEHEFRHLTQDKAWIGDEVPPCDTG